ncbi:hypothetical protein L9F63_007888, partial [Diploptera punctata]
NLNHTVAFKSIVTYVISVLIYFIQILCVKITLISQFVKIPRYRALSMSGLRDHLLTHAKTFSFALLVEKLIMPINAYLQIFSKLTPLHIIIFLT